MNRILITGSAGFIGFHLSNEILKNKNNIVVGIDNLNNFYDPKLKVSRNKILKKKKNYKFFKGDISNINFLKKIYKKFKFDYVINLAAQAGVRYSLKEPRKYLKSNIDGFYNILELSKNHKVKHFVYASTSSVYGMNKKMPFSEKDSTDHPIQLYAVTKKTNELMAHAFSYLYNIPTTGLRFFTVYGPWGRPDMALFDFAEKISNGKKIKVFNNGNHQRDFTYVDDIVSGILKCLKSPPKSIKKKHLLPGESFAPYKIYNIGSEKPIQLMNYINLLEKYLGKKSKKIFVKMQLGDIKKTYSNVDKLKKEKKYKITTDINIGIKKFVEWFNQYYSKK